MIKVAIVQRRITSFRGPPFFERLSKYTGMNVTVFRIQFGFMHYLKYLNFKSLIFTVRVPHKKYRLDEQLRRNYIDFIKLLYIIISNKKGTRIAR